MKNQTTAPGGVSVLSDDTAAPSRNTEPLAQLLRARRPELNDEMIKSWAPILAKEGWLAKDRLGVKAWTDNNGVELTAGWGNHETAGLLIPYSTPDGEPVTYGNGRQEFSRVRLWPPDGGRKYLQPQGSGNYLFFPPTGPEGLSVLALAKREGYIVATEGELDATWATFLGVPTIGLAGVDSWKRAPKRKETGPDGRYVWVKGDSVPIADLDAVPWGELEVLVVFDSDADTKPQVCAARRRFSEHVAKVYGARVLVCKLPKGPEKVGFGDWLCRLYRDGVAIAGELDKLRAEARRVGRRPHAHPVPLDIPGEQTIPDLTQMTDEYLKKLIAERKQEREKSDGDEIPARDTILNILEGESAARAVVFRYGLDLRGLPWNIREEGVEQVKTGDKGCDRQKPVTSRAIWPAQTGRDLATGTEMALLKWLDNRWVTREAWVHLRHLSHSKNLIGDGARELELDALPVSEGNARQVSAWLTDAVGWLVDGKRDAVLSSRQGWVETPEGWLYVHPGSEAVILTSGAPASKGSVEGWARGLDVVLSLEGDRLLQNLALLGLCAAAPLVRFTTDARNPVIGLTAESSSGKGTLAEFALAMYGPPSESTYQSMQSTAKGLEGLALKLQDRPLRIDDAQTRDEGKLVEEWVYFLGNGQSRTRSSRSGKVVGGEVWRGVGMFLAEYPLADRFAKGANLRTVEFNLAPLVPGEMKKQADAIQAVTRHNTGAMAGALFEAIGDPVRRGQAVDALAIELRDGLASRTKGSDTSVMALACVGVELLQKVTGRPLASLREDMCTWLGNHITATRAQAVDASTQAWDALMSLLAAAMWTSAPDTRTDTYVWVQQNIVAAWYVKNGYLDINPEHPVVRNVLHDYGGHKRHLDSWLRDEKIVRGKRHKLIERRCSGERKGYVLRVSNPSVVTSVVTFTEKIDKSDDAVS